MARTPKTTPAVAAKKQPVITLTQEQFDTIRDIIDENLLEEIESIATCGEDDLSTIGFNLGVLYVKLSKQFEQINNILCEIEPPLIWFDEDYTEEDKA